MEIAMPGTPCDCIAFSTLASRSAGSCVASAGWTNSSVASTTAAEQKRDMEISILESGKRRGEGPRRAMSQVPHADGQQGHHVDHQEQPGQCAITPRDEIDQAEAGGDEDGTDQQHRGDGEAVSYTHLTLPTS